MVRSWDFMVDEELPASRASSGSLQHELPWLRGVTSMVGKIPSMGWLVETKPQHRGRDELGVPSQFSEAAAAILLAASENSERGGKGRGFGSRRGLV